MSTHSNRKGIKEDEWREISKKFCRVCRLPSDLEFRFWDKRTKKYRRNDMMVKYKAQKLSELKETSQNNNITIHDLIHTHIVNYLSIDLQQRNWQLVLFDTRLNKNKQGNTLVSTIQVPIRSTIEANQPDDTQQFEIEEVQSVASRQIQEAEHLSWDPEITVCQGYVQALIDRFGYQSLVSAAKSVKAGII